MRFMDGKYGNRMKTNWQILHLSVKSAVEGWRYIAGFVFPDVAECIYFWIRADMTTQCSTITLKSFQGGSSWTVTTRKRGWRRLCGISHSVSRQKQVHISPNNPKKYDYGSSLRDNDVGVACGYGCDVRWWLRIFLVACLRCSTNRIVTFTGCADICVTYCDVWICMGYPAGCCCKVCVWVGATEIFCDLSKPHI